jgi:cytidylate kinase
MSVKSSSERATASMEHMLRHWQRERKAEAQVQGRERSHIRFTIAISREAGAKGAAIARVLGESLDWPVYDKELLDRIAEEMGLRSSLLESVDEKQQNWLQECLEAFISAPTVTRGGYVRHLVEVLLSLAAHGECIIVGRGAPQVLPPATTLRVRLVAGIKDRIATMQKRHGLTLADATSLVEKTDRERTEFVKEHFHRDPNDPRIYDLILNSSRFTEKECAEIIIAALCKWSAR